MCVLGITVLTCYLEMFMFTAVHREMSGSLPGYSTHPSMILC